MARIYGGLLYVHYGQAYVESGRWEYMEDCFHGQTNGLCGAAEPGVLFLMTGLHTGRVGFTLDVLETPPPIDESWEEIVEVSFTPVSDEVILRDWNGECVCEIPLLQETYRVRYYARNMDHGREIDTTLEDGLVVDFYALIFWQAAPAPDAVIKQISEIADCWHEYARTSKR